MSKTFKVQSWLDYLHEQGKSAATVTSYGRALKHFMAWSHQTYGQVFDPASIIPRDVADWKAYQQTIEKAAASTINQRLAALSGFFSWAVESGLTHNDPTADIHGLRLEARRPKALDEKQTRRLLRAVHRSGNLRDIALIELLLGTGLRVSETLSLQLDDLTIDKRSGSVTVRRGKGGQTRSVPLTAPVRSALTAYLAKRPVQSTRLAARWLWLGERGRLKDPAGIYKLLKKHARQAGLDAELVSPHVLRHTFASRYLAANPGDLRGLAALLGHASLDSVMIYTEPTTEDLARRMEKAEIAG